MTYSSTELSKLLPEKMELEQTDIADKVPRNGYTNNQERVLRVLSWMSAAEESEIVDVRLMCALVAFNGLYAIPEEQKRKMEMSESKIRNDMIVSLINFDKDGILLEYLKNERRDDLEKILASQYLFFDYWEFYDSCETPHGEFSDMDEMIKIYNLHNSYSKNPIPLVPPWATTQSEANKKIWDNLEKGDAAWPLRKIMPRIWALRNQLMHGAAGYNDYYNRSQVEVCANFLLPLVGRMLRIMIDNYNSSWGEVACSPQGGKPDVLTYKYKSLTNKKNEQNEKRD